MIDKEKIIVEHTRLAREYSELPVSAESPEAYAPVAAKKHAILARIQELKELEKEW